MTGQGPIHSYNCRVAICARVDGYADSPNGEEGQKFREMIQKRLDKLQEAPPRKLVKPLPAPDDKPKKRRGGRR